MLQKRSRSLNKMKNTLAVAILVVCLKTGSGLLSQKPQDSVTVVGKSAYFNCSTSEPSKPILWYHYATNEVHRETIYQHANFSDYWYPCYRNGRYVVERNPATGAFNLVIHMVLLSDAGRYLCEVEGDEGVATLTVQVEPNPTCAASEICKPYSDAIICIILIVLPVSIGATIFVMRYPRVVRPKKLKQKEIKVEDEAQLQLSSNGSPKEETEQLGLMLATNAQTTKIQELENQLEHKEDQLQKQLDEMRQLEAKVKDLEQHLCSAGNIAYAENPILVQTIPTGADKEQREPINGITILGKELFVSHENNSVIQVYDTATFQTVRNFSIYRGSYPMDIASCKIANCLYIIRDSKSKSHVMKLDPTGEMIKDWPTGGESGRLSTYESNVIVCLVKKQMIDEYTTDGKLICTVSLSPAVGFNHPWHAIKVTSSDFAVCHGDAKDDLHRVCIIDAQGNIKQELREGKSKKKDGKLNVPICLVKGCERSILVADRDNQKVRLLNCFLKFQKDIITQETGLKDNPVRICLDETKRLLCVATNTLKYNEWRDGEILIFNIK